MKTFVAWILAGCVSTAACGAAPESAPEAEAPRPAVVAVGFSDDLDSALWKDILEESPEHALFFAGLRHKFNAGLAVDVAEWGTSTLFRPTPELVELMLSDPYSPRAAELMQPTKRNEVLKVESRGYMVGDDRVRLDLTTVQETATSPEQVEKETLSSRTYYLARVEGAETSVSTADGLPASQYALVAAEASR